MRKGKPINEQELVRIVANNSGTELWVTRRVVEAMLNIMAAAANTCGMAFVVALVEQHQDEGD